MMRYAWIVWQCPVTWRPSVLTLTITQALRPKRHWMQAPTIALWD